MAVIDEADQDREPLSGIPKAGGLEIVDCGRRNCHLIYREDYGWWCKACLLDLIERAHRHPAFGHTFRRLGNTSLAGRF